MLALDDVSIIYAARSGPVQAVSGVTLHLPVGGSLGLVGESGCGKSTLALAALSLLPPEARLSSGAVRLEGQDLATLPEAKLRRLRWTRMAYVPQSAQNALVPVHSLRRQFRDTAAAHGMRSAAADERAAALFQRVELDPAILDRFPHELSGGMRQRAMIALALLFGPSLLVADEPTTGLDVIVQRQVIDLLRDLRTEDGLALLFISHDIGVVAELCSHVAVLYAGKVMESGATDRVFSLPNHPYTMGLQRAFPDIRHPERSIVSIAGHPPRLSAPPQGCPFAPRCPFAQPLCHNTVPSLVAGPDGRAVACHFAADAEALRDRARDPALWDAAA
ncbi:ABC transporter ATP-binding protein [Elioraea sp.]|uniref:ABC transporter ATP-binding protein n=1 Tax=Elioraea sp. TaxID=2185103 RepID=UPI0025B81331|nr:ABC transporter ATP-binding protein [Elioraea sp.]